MSKAFDRVDHHVLIEKITNSLPSGFVSWLRSYLSGRSFQVRIHGELSTPHYQAAGVPQGSVLGPALFSILVGDISKHNKDNVFIQYADDLNIICPFVDITQNTLQQRIVNQLEEVALWCSRNKQELNMDKSKFLLCTRQPLCLDDHFPIQRVRSMKVLGIILNEKLTWDEHVKELCKKASQRLHVLRKVKPYLDQSELHTVYCSMIRSLFEYCCPV